MFREQNLKSLVYLMNVLGSSSVFIEQKQNIFRKFRPSSLRSIYSGVMLLIFLFSALAMIFGIFFRDNTDKKP